MRLASLIIVIGLFLLYLVLFSNVQACGGYSPDDKQDTEDDLTDYDYPEIVPRPDYTWEER